jgi:hypothetical protein
VVVLDSVCACTGCDLMMDGLVQTNLSPAGSRLLPPEIILKVRMVVLPWLVTGTRMERVLLLPSADLNGARRTIRLMAVAGSFFAASAISQQ